MIPMNKTTIALIAAMVVVGFIVFYKMTSNREEKFTINDMTENDVMSMYKNVQPKDLMDYYGGLDNLTKVLVEHNIPASLLSDPLEYPKIASYLTLKNVPKSD